MHNTTPMSAGYQQNVLSDHCFSAYTETRIESPQPHLVSACTSMLSSVSPCPLPGTRRRKPLWLTGVRSPALPGAGDGGVICDVQRARLRANSAAAADIAAGSCRGNRTSLLLPSLLRILQSCVTRVRSEDDLV